MIMICLGYEETEKYLKLTMIVLIHNTIDSTEQDSLKTVTPKTQYFLLPNQFFIIQSNLLYLVTFKNYQVVLPLILLLVLCWKNLIANLCYPLGEKMIFYNYFVKQVLYFLTLTLHWKRPSHELVLI